MTTEIIIEQNFKIKQIYMENYEKFESALNIALGLSDSCAFSCLDVCDF